MCDHLLAAVHLSATAHWSRQQDSRPPLGVTPSVSVSVNTERERERERGFGVCILVRQTGLQTDVPSSADSWRTPLQECNGTGDSGSTWARVHTVFSSPSVGFDYFFLSNCRISSWSLLFLDSIPRLTLCQQMKRWLNPQCSLEELNVWLYTPVRGVSVWGFKPSLLIIFCGGVFQSSSWESKMFWSRHVFITSVGLLT